MAPVTNAGCGEVARRGAASTTPARSNESLTARTPPASHDTALPKVCRGRAMAKSWPARTKLKAARTSPLRCQPRSVRRHLDVSSQQRWTHRRQRHPIAWSGRSPRRVL